MYLPGDVENAVGHLYDSGSVYQIDTVDDSQSNDGQHLLSYNKVLALKSTLVKIKQTMGQLQNYVAKAGEQTMNQLQQHVSQFEEQFEMLQSDAKGKKRAASQEKPCLSKNNQFASGLSTKRKRTEPISLPQGSKLSGTVELDFQDTCIVTLFLIIH